MYTVLIKQLFCFCTTFACGRQAAVWMPFLQTQLVTKNCSYD